MTSTQNSSYQRTNSQKSDINILLLGETGVGKSTFINSFVNYLQHTTLEKAKKSKLIALIPSRFTIPDENFTDRIVEFGYDENEDIEIGNSSTQGARSYVFNYDNKVIRLIDTPGIGDARGIDQDGINFENVLSYISQYKELHAICFLLKPNVSVLNAYFKFCIMHLLSRLEKTAANNIVFIFTNCRSTFYRPGETLPVLRRVLQEIEDASPHVKIPCAQKNMFCVDNEAFKFLVALQQNIRFGEYEVKEFSNSWERSYNTCKEFISYVCGEGSISPHPVQNTISVNEARRNIINLSKPLADICDVIQDNITILKRHEESMNQDNLSKAELIDKLYVPVVELNVKTLQQPVTVCTATKCSEIYTVEGLSKYHYKQRCHNPCYLTNVPKEIIGTPELINCAAMCGQTCTRCGCIFSAHMHIYYETEAVTAKREDKNVKRHIKTKDDAIAAKNYMVDQLKKVSAEYEYEKKEISKCMAKFAHFLKENSIAVYNDAYIDYLDYLIEREKLLGFRKDQDRINHYMSLKKHYELEKKILDDTMLTLRKTHKNAITITPESVLNLVKDLYQLPHTGKKIKMLHTIQQKSVENTIKRTEYQHSTAMSSTDRSCSSSEDEDESKPDVGDFEILENLIKEDSLEAMRLKLKDMKLAGSRKEVDDRKQKIFTYLTNLSEKAAGNESKDNSKTGTNNKGKGRGGGRKQQQGRSPRNSFENRYPNHGQNQNQNNYQHAAFNQQRPPLFQTPPHLFNQQQRSYPPQNQNPSYYPQNPNFNSAQRPGFYNQNPVIRPLLATPVSYPYGKIPVNEMGHMNTPHQNYRAGSANNRGAPNTNQRGNNRRQFKKSNNRYKNQNKQSNVSEDSSESEEDNDSKPQDPNKTYELMRKLMEEKLNKKGKSDAGSVFMYYHKK